MTSQVSFSMDAAQSGDLVGLTLFVDTGGEDYTCFRMLFRGPVRGEAAFVKLFEKSHQEAMDKVGLRGQVDEELFEMMLEESLNIAGQLMMEHGYLPVVFDDVEPELQMALFSVFSDDHSLN